MPDYLSSRSRLVEAQRCPRSGYLLHEAFGQGYELVKQSIPQATGKAGHEVLRDLLRGYSAEESINQALAGYEESCAKRGLNVKELEDQSKVYQEQRALIEGVGRLAALRVVPALLATYEVLEVEKMDSVTLWEDEAETGYDPASLHRRGIWRSIPDALLRHRESGDLYILSWKIPAELPRDSDARTDMQGLSETWALEQRLNSGMDHRVFERTEYGAHAGPISIRGVQMAYLLKGRKVSAKEDGAVDGAVGKSWRHNSPLVWGYRDQSFPPKLAWSREWRCSAPHPMRKSKWYPSGECPGDGRNHRRGDEWAAFPAWEAMGVRDWIDTLASGEITPEAGSALDFCWSLPVPNFRPTHQVERWHRQAVVQAHRIARDLDQIRIYEAAEDEHGAFDARLRALDELFPQHTEKWCNDTYGSKCPAWEICWGPDSTAQDPVGSGLYQPRTPYHEPLPEEVEG